MHPDFARALLLHADIGETRGIFADEHDREHRFFPRFAVGNLGLDSIENGGCHESSVENHREKRKMSGEIQTRYEKTAKKQMKGPVYAEPFVFTDDFYFFSSSVGF